MFRKTLISSVAIAALSISGAAFAQGASDAAPKGGASSSPSPSASPKATGTAPGLESNRNDVPRGTPGSERAQERTGTSTSPSTKPGASGSATTDSKAGASGSATTATDSKPGSGAAGTGARTGSSETRQSGSDRITTGQVPKVEISSQQRTELRSRFRQANIRTVSRDQINVAIAVGAVLPATVTFMPIPDPILTLVPAFRGYHAVQVGDQILIIEPGTRRIVYVIDA
jgi:hypothetical protein